MGLRVASVKKTNNRNLQISGVPASELVPMTATRILGKERQRGQYKLENGSTEYFRNFKSLQHQAVNLAIHRQYKYIVLVRDDNKG
jgi:hypothetical protein